MGRRNQIRNTGLTKEKLAALYAEHTDAEIAATYGVTDVAISYFRRKWGIQTKTLRQRTDEQRGGPRLEDVTPARLADLYATMGDRDIARMHGVTKPVIAKLRHRWAISSVSKSERATSHQAMTEEQKDACIGVLLGDGHLLDRGVMKVTHYQEQLGYLMHLHGILAPHSLPLRYEEKEIDTGRLTFAFGFQTVQHEWLQAMRAVFYPKGERTFPKSILQDLSPRALAFWYFDDGHLGDGLPSFALGSITEDAVSDVVRMVGERFSIQTYVRPSNPECRSMGIRASSCDVFFKLILPFASADMLYKFPAKYWPNGIPPRIPLKTTEVLVPRGLIAEAHRWESLCEDERESLVEAFVQFWVQAGFPYHTPRPEELTVLLNLDASHVIQGDVIKARQVGQGICQGILRHIWDARSYGSQSPVELFSDPRTLRELIRFVLKMGEVPNANRLRGALRFWKKSGVYNFRPSAAKALVDRYCISGGTVLDPCAGYGGRLLGTILSRSHPRYIGFEPAIDTREGLNRLHKWICSYLPVFGDKVDIRATPAEDAEYPKDVDMVLTSPPYWKRETYANEATQSGARFETYDAWLHGFWRKVLEKSLNALHPGGWLVVNVDDFNLGGRDYPLIEDTRRIVADLGWGRGSLLTYALPGGTEDTPAHEAVLCWPKGVTDKPLSNNSTTIPSLPTCKGCGKVFSSAQLVNGLCDVCRAPIGQLVKCKGCPVEFRTTRSDRLFHDDVCYARYKRRIEREKNPSTGIRTFTCTRCLAQWQTKDAGSFKLCAACKQDEDIANRIKKCAYRHCGQTFTDISPKNGMKFCCPEHGRREKLLRSGLVTDESHFRDPNIKYQPRCVDCKSKWTPSPGEKNNRCPSCREKRRHKTCGRCGGAFLDKSENNTRRYCDACPPQVVFNHSKKRL